MNIDKGTFRLENRNLKFDIDDDLNFNTSGGCFYFRGDNGFGKTSFLEKIVIPSLKTERLSYLYIGQDIRTQFYTLRALLSTKGLKVSDTDEIELLKLWFRQSQTASVLILDEFDKYFPDYGFIFDWSEAFIRTYIIVTHLDKNRCEAVAKNHRIFNVKFELINMDGHIKHIRVRNE